MVITISIHELESTSARSNPDLKSVLKAKPSERSQVPDGCPYRYLTAEIRPKIGRKNEWSSRDRRRKRRRENGGEEEEGGRGKRKKMEGVEKETKISSS
jgi:hypothetical protein